LALSGTAAEAHNALTGKVEALLRDSHTDATTTIHATEANAITATAVSASLSFALAAGGSAGGALAVSGAFNDVGSKVHAGSEGGTLDGASITVAALSDDSVKATSVGVSIGVSGALGVAMTVSGAGAEARNAITGYTDAVIGHDSLGHGSIV